MKTFLLGDSALASKTAAIPVHSCGTIKLTTVPAVGENANSKKKWKIFL